MGTLEKRIKREKIEKEEKAPVLSSFPPPPHVSTEVINGEMGLFLLPIKKTAKS